MKTIFIIMHDTTYTTRDGGKPKIAFERKEDAERMLEIFKDTTRGELTIVEVPLQAAPVANINAPYVPMFSVADAAAIKKPDGRIKEMLADA